MSSTEERFTQLIKRVVSKDGSITQGEFCRFLEQELPDELPEFNRIVDRFIAAAKKWRWAQQEELGLPQLGAIQRQRQKELESLLGEVFSVLDVDGTGRVKVADLLDVDVAGVHCFI